MNTLPPDYPESRNMRLEGAALAYDGEQVDLRASELPYQKHVNAAYELAQRAHFDPSEIDQARNENFVAPQMTSPTEKLSPEQANPIPHFVGTIGSHLSMLRQEAAGSPVVTLQPDVQYTEKYSDAA